MVLFFIQVLQLVKIKTYYCLMQILHSSTTGDAELLESMDKENDSSSTFTQIVSGTFHLVAGSSQDIRIM
jgi:hypothetical protein